MTIERTERIAAGVEVLECERGDVYVNLNGYIINANTTRFEATVQTLAEVHAIGRPCNYGSDPMKYVEGAAKP